METTFTEAKGLARVFKLITLATLIAVIFNLIGTFGTLFTLTNARFSQLNFFNVLIGIGIELGRLVGAFWLFSIVARGEYISLGLVKACRLLSFIEFLRCFQFLQLLLLGQTNWHDWRLYTHLFQSISGTLVTASLFYCLGTAIHWAVEKQRKEDERRLLEKLNALPPLDGPAL